MKKLNGIIFASLFIAAAAAVNADVKPASIFGSNMVLQQQKPVKVWGSAEPSEKVTVTLDKDTQSTQADKAGKWSVTFPARKASFEPVTLTIEGKNKITLNNILVGEVWICGGQSNMQWPLNHANNATQEIAEANYPNIRLFTVAREIAAAPKDTLNGAWSICSPQTIPNFSAVGYFFGRDIYKTLNMPVGLISSNWGGTQVEAWTPLEYVEQVESLQARLAKEKPLLDPETRQKILNEFHERLKQYNEAYDNAIQTAEDPKSAEKYSATDFDDSGWKTMKVPCQWSQGGLPNYEGYVWFRKTIQMPHPIEGMDMQLHLGPIDEIDVTFFNGVEVGRSGSIKPLNVKFWDKPRIYNIPVNIQKAGKNVIAVRMANTRGPGGFYGMPASEMFIGPAALDGKGPKISLAGEWKYLPVAKFPKNKPSNPSSPNNCSVLYNAMINPMAGFPVRGAIWYQGEANAGRAYQYRQLMPLMIKAWRDRWGDQSMVFIQTQLANFYGRKNTPSQSAWAELREAQLMTAQKDSLGGMAVIIDIGEANNIHPKNKQDVGKRLALQAEKLAYGRNIPFESPIYKSMKIEGNKVRLSFDGVYEGLVAKGGELKGFAIAGADENFVWAKAKIDGSDVIVWSDEVEQPVAVRYGWADNPECTLYNSAGLPASPLRTDDWPGVTVNNK